MIRLSALVLFVCLLGSLPAAAQKKIKIKDPVALADTLMARERFEEAIPVLTGLTADVNPEKALTARYKRSVCYFFTGRFDQAKADLVQVLASAPNATRAWILLAYVEQERDDEDGMLQALDEVILRVPDESEFRSWRARLLIDEGEYGKAMEDLTHGSMAADPRTELFLGMAEYGLNGLAAALAHFDKAIALEPGYPTNYLYAGSYCLDEERYEEADAYFSAGLSRASGHLDLMMYKGYTLVELKQVEEGCRLLRKAFYAGNEDAGDYLNEYCFRYAR